MLQAPREDVRGPIYLTMTWEIIQRDETGRSGRATVELYAAPFRCRAPEIRLLGLVARIRRIAIRDMPRRVPHARHRGLRAWTVAASQPGIHMPNVRTASSA